MDITFLILIFLSSAGGSFIVNSLTRRHRAKQELKKAKEGPGKQTEIPVACGSCEAILKLEIESVIVTQVNGALTLLAIPDQITFFAHMLTHDDGTPNE